LLLEIRVGLNSTLQNRLVRWELPLLINTWVLSNERELCLRRAKHESSLGITYRGSATDTMSLSIWKKLGFWSLLYSFMAYVYDTSILSNNWRLHPKNTKRGILFSKASSKRNTYLKSWHKATTLVRNNVNKKKVIET
jgi:hypothetical protein